MKHLSLPLNAACVMALRVGEPVMVSGLVVTARDRAHKWLYETFVQGHMLPTAEDRAIYQELATILKGGAIYHCGPIVKKDEDGWHLVAAGPTTSEREEPYEAAVMKHFQVRLIIGKGGMGKRTLQACCEVPALYLNAVGGAAVVAAARIPRIISVHKLDFGIPEALWVMEMVNFPAIVTMDTAGNSLHEHVATRSQAILKELISRR